MNHDEATSVKAQASDSPHPDASNSSVLASCPGNTIKREELNSKPKCLSEEAELESAAPIDASEVALAKSLETAVKNSTCGSVSRKETPDCGLYGSSAVDASEHTPAANGEVQPNPNSGSGYADELLSNLTEIDLNEACTAIVYFTDWHQDSLIVKQSERELAEIEKELDELQSAFKDVATLVRDKVNYMPNLSWAVVVFEGSNSGSWYSCNSSWEGYKSGYGESGKGMALLSFAI